MSGSTESATALPLKPRINPREYDQQIYKRHNDVERLLRRLKGYRYILRCVEAYYDGSRQVSPLWAPACLLGLTLIP